MKKTLLLALACLLPIIAFAKDKGEKILLEDLPEKAALFIKDYFSDFKIKTIYKELDSDGIEEYKVNFRSKSSIEFDMVGAWSEIKINTKKDKMPRFIYPKAINETIDSQFYELEIEKVENDGVYYEFDFKGDSELKIKSSGEIIELEKNN